MTPQERLEAAMARQLDAMDAAERQGQPENVLERMWGAYMTALQAYERLMGKRQAA